MNISEFCIRRPVFTLLLMMALVVGGIAGYSSLAISAIRSNPILRRFYQQLRQRNKPPKVALVAVIRKLAILLNHLLQNPSFLPAS